MDTFWPFQFVRAAFRFCSFNCTHPAPLSLSSSGFLRSYFFFAAYCTTPCCYNLHLPQCIFRCLGFVNNCCIFLLSVLCVHQWLTIFVKAVTHMPDIHFVFSFIRGDRVQEINCSKPFQANNPSVALFLADEFSSQRLYRVAKLHLGRLHSELLRPMIHTRKTRLSLLLSLRLGHRRNQIWPLCNKFFSIAFPYLWWRLQIFFTICSFSAT